MQQVLNDVLARRRDRSIAILLGMKERECDQYLPRDVSARLRKIILDQINEYHDFVLDVCRSLDSQGEVVLNEYYLDRIDAIYESTVRRGQMMVANGDS